MKQCKTCNAVLPLQSFSGKKNICKECRAAAARKNREKPCADCKELFMPEGRRASRCADCYPVFRQAVTLFHSAKFRAEKKEIEFDLTPDWIQDRLRQPCPRTGVAFALLQSSDGYGDRGPYGPSLDKIDPSKGYTKENVQVVCWWYNAAKQRFSDEEVLNLCEMVVKKAAS